MEDVVGKPEIDEHGNETVHEPPDPRNPPAIDGIVGLDVEGAVEGNSCQGSGPDSLGRVDQESTGETGKTVTNEVRREGHGN